MTADTTSAGKGYSLLRKMMTLNILAPMLTT
jgi:hypothetical protein